MSIADEDRTVYRDYMKKRNDSLYVRPNEDGTAYDPSEEPEDIEERRKEITDTISYLWAWFEVIWLNDFEGDLGNLDYYKLTPKENPEKINITFSGTGKLIPRKEEEYYPDSVKRRLRKI